MKKLIAMFLAFMMCLSLCACSAESSSAIKLTTEMIEEALEDCGCELDFEMKGDYVVSFTCVVEDINADDLMDKEFTSNAFMTLLTDSSKCNMNQFEVCKAVLPFMGIEILLSELPKEEAIDFIDFLDRALCVICDKKTMEYSGWKVSAKVDNSSDSMTITVTSK